MVLNATLDQFDLLDIYRAFNPKTASYVFSSSAHGAFSRIDHILGHKTSFNKFKKIEIISGIFFGAQWHETRNQLQEKHWKKHK